MSGVLVVMEQRGGAWNRMSLETLAAGQEVAAALGVGCSAAVLGGSVQALAGELSGKKLEKVLAVEDPLLTDYTPDAYAAAVTALVGQTGASVVLFPHTYQVRDFAPKVATRFSQVLVSDVTRVKVEDGKPVFVRLLFQGKLNGDVRMKGDGPFFASIQAGAYRADQVLEGAASMEVINPSIAADVVRTQPESPFRESARAVDLTSAELIVSVGRGIKEKENIGLVEELAAAMGAEIAASRPICDNGWLPMERQVGSSGQTVSPKLYMAIGISGAIQHLVGMKGAKCIVAINKDANAPIFEVADIGVVGDLFEVVPALVEEIKKAKS